jgi:hypothetical protein
MPPNALVLRRGVLFPVAWSDFIGSVITELHLITA